MRRRHAAIAFSDAGISTENAMRALRGYRERGGHTLAEVEAGTSIGIRSISLFENDALRLERIRFSTLLVLLDYYGVPLNMFLVHAATGALDDAI